MNKDELPSDVDQLRDLVLQLSETVSEQQEKIEKHELKIRELLQALRGKHRERIDPDQLLLFDIGDIEQIAEEETETPTPARRRKRRRGGRLIPDNLPQEEVIHELPEDQRRCPHDGKPMAFIRFETSKQLEYEPSKMKVIVHKRAVYACADKHDEAKPAIAPKPPQPVEKGLAGPGLLAQVVLSKFGDHLPGYRLEDIFSRHGVQIRRSTIYDWLSAAADLARPLYTLMKHHVLASKVIHTDDTQVKLIDTSIRSTRLARFWAYLGDGRHPYTVYDFTQTRERAGPEEFLKGFQGYLQADAYGGYDGVYLQSRGKITEVACWAHCRRYWYKAREQDPARAHHVLAVIRRLYDVERAGRDQDAVIRQSLRQEYAAPLLSDLKAWLDDQEFLPKSLSGKAATYTANQWEALGRYVEDGDLSIDNNAAERAMRPVAVGRKNWLFVGSPAAGDRASVLMSLVGSCKENQVEPWAYLRSIFTQLPADPGLEQLLPDRWLADHPEHRWRIADQRKEERLAKA
jgi:transposase